MPGTIHMLCGFIGAGKTTFARQLESEVKGLRLNNDYVMTTLFGQEPQEQPTLSIYRSRLEDIHLHYAERLLALNVDVIFDNGFWGRAVRDQMRAFATRNGASLKMYYIDTPLPVMRERLKTRAVTEKDGNFRITPELWDRLLPLFEPPTRPDEDFIHIDGRATPYA